MEYIVSITFSKKGILKYISHLDLLRLFQRSARRTELPVSLTKGFKPRLKIKLLKALALGIESDNEEAVISLTKNLSLEEIKKRLHTTLPDEIRIKDIKWIPK